MADLPVPEKKGCAICGFKLKVMTPTLPAENTHRIVLRFGVFVAMSAAVVTLITFTIAVLTPPLSGPFCQGGCFEYPYTDIASRFPGDYYWMYPAMIVALLFLVLMVCIHHYAADDKKIFSHLGVSLAVIATTVLLVNYFVQLSVVQPSLIKGETEGIALITQFNPHGFFIALDELGFLLICLAFAATVPVFSGGDAIDRSIRITFITSLTLAILFLTFVSVEYGIMREYLFEVAIISVVWLEMIIASVLLSLLFRRKLREMSGQAEIT